MIGTPLTLKGAIPRSVLSQETFKRFSNKVQEIRNISQSFVEYLLLVHKGIEMYNTSLVKQCQLLQTHVNNDMNDDKRYYLQFSMIFQAVSINFEHFICTFESNLKQYHVSTCMELDELTTSHLDCLVNIYKKYRGMQDLLAENIKKWLKSQKQLSESIKSYNESLVDPRLIYNKQETNKRYLNCEINHQNAMKEESSLKEKMQRLYEQKRACVHYQNKLIEQYKKSYEFIFERIVLQAKNTLNLFSNVHKMVVSDIASKKKAFEETRIKPFLYFLPDISNQKHFFDVPPNYKQTTNFPIFLQNPQSIKDAHLKLYSKWLSQYGLFLKQSGQNNKKLLKRVHQFLFQTTRTVEKMEVLIIKQIPVYYQKMKKKLIELFGSKSLDFIKSINATLDTSMRIYQKLIKVLYQKLQNINTLINQDNKTSQMFFKQYNKQLDLFNNDTKLFNILQHRKQIRKAITQKAEVLKFYINTFGQKITKNNQSFRIETKSIINEIFESYNEIFIYSSEYQHTYFGAEFVESLKKVRDSMVIAVPLENINDTITKQLVEVEENQRFKYQEFQKIRRAQTFLKKQDKQAKPEDNSENQEQLREHGSPIAKKLSIDIDPKEKKNYDFLLKKITLEQGQQFKHTFKCALYDKILLQGKLYVTNLRLCFHSYFNTANLFFGTTFLQIPKKDILKAEKRYNAKIFDNSVSITTVNGEVFFTSFFSRDEAFKQITSAFGLKVQQQENKQEEQKVEDEEKEPEVEQVQNKQSKDQVVVQPVVEQKQEDDVNEQDINVRVEKLQQVINKKMNVLGVSTIKNANCLYLLKKVFANQQYIHNNKKYSVFYEFIKQSLGEKQLSVENWQPDIQAHLNKISIKKDTPLRFNRKAKFNHTLPNSSIPFMPKFCKTEESHRLSIVSNQRFIIDIKITSKGAPYTDTFIVYTRQDYKNTDKGVEITSSIQIQFIKKSMMQGFIEKQTLKEMKQSMDNYVKFINKIVTSDSELKKKKQKAKVVANPNGSTTVEQPGAQPEQINEEKAEEASEQSPITQNLEEKYATLLKNYGQLEKKNVLFRNVIIGLIILNILSLLF